MKLAKFLPSAVTFSLLALVLAAAAAQSTAQGRTLLATPPNFMVAFIGDQGLGSNARAVLELIRNEGADMVVVQGDLGYNENDATAPARWGAMVSETLGADFPLFVSQGNHDVGQWSQYRQLLQARLNAVSGETCTGDIGVQSTCSYQGLTFTSTYGRADAAYIRDAHANTDSLWTVCSWHHNQQAMQVGGKSDEVGWEPYEACREAGAIIATAHEHSYERTKSLSNMQSQSFGLSNPSAADLLISPGQTFAFVSGLGGASIRDQERCLPSAPPYGCHGEWANIYTSTQGAKYGALFMEFNVHGNSRQARGYFKNIAGEIVDEFTVINNKPGVVADEHTSSNNAPALSLEPDAAPFTVAQGQTLTFAATAVDLDGDTLSLDMPNLADFPGATFTLLSSSTPTPTPTATPGPTASPTVSPTATPSPSVSPTPSPTPSLACGPEVSVYVQDFRSRYDNAVPASKDNLDIAGFWDFAGQLVYSEPQENDDNLRLNREVVIEAPAGGYIKQVRYHGRDNPHAFAAEVRNQAGDVIRQLNYVAEKKEGEEEEEDEYPPVKETIMLGATAKAIVWPAGTFLAEDNMLAAIACGPAAQ